MILERIYDEKLAQASYLIGCGDTGDALVIDPNRDAQQYVAVAARHRLTITHVTETHIHADFVSGSLELVEATGARLYLSDEGGPDWRYAFARERDVTLLHDGDTFSLGNIRVRALHTPGHTPEHLSFEITDTAGADRPVGIVTGDFIFVGDVGRPDLLEKAAKVEGTMETGARTLFRSIQRFKADVADWTQLWPGHGAGSACGKSLGAMPSTTLGYEKRFNWGVAEQDEEAFVRAVLSDQPEPPRYFAEMKRINRDGPRILGGFPEPAHVPDDRLADLLEAGAIVVDMRASGEFALAHVPGTINIPLNRSFTTWAGSLLPYDRDVYLIAAEGGHAGGAAGDVRAASRDLAMIGLDRVAGWFGASAIEAWRRDGGELEAIPQIDAAELARRIDAGAVSVLDVRGASEWNAGHLPGVPNIPLAALGDHLDELPARRPIVLHCQGGTRSAIAASLLQANGIKDVVNLTGGFREWAGGGNSVEREPAGGPAEGGDAVAAANAEDGR